MDFDVLETDRISSLPNDILCHILSFLPTKEAVRTSILSKSWRNTWIGTSVLEFELFGYGKVTVNIYAPSLMSLELTGLLHKYSLGNPSNLVDAGIDVRDSYESENHVVKLLRSISNVRCLTVSGLTISILCAAVDSFHKIVLPNLTTLIVTSPLGCPSRLTSRGFRKFIHMIPNLQSLHFINGIGRFIEEDDIEEDGNEILAEILSSFLSHLKAIEIENFRGGGHELSLLVILIKNAKVLERMNIRPSKELEASVLKQYEVLRHLLTFRRRCPISWLNSQVAK